jgi:DNA-directed RNA polymerase subunit N (RpoN/RPB10)
MFPVRCFTCGKVIAHLLRRYLEYNDANAALKALGIKRYCCRTHFVTYCAPVEVCSTFEGQVVPNILQIDRKSTFTKTFTAR